MSRGVSKYRYNVRDLSHGYFLTPYIFLVRLSEFSYLANGFGGLAEVGGSFLSFYLSIFLRRWLEF